MCLPLTNLTDALSKRVIFNGQLNISYYSSFHVFITDIICCVLILIYKDKEQHQSEIAPLISSSDHTLIHSMYSTHVQNLKSAA